MKILLHIGAHRCATATFQHYMTANAPALRDMGIAFWGPDRLRRGMLHGLLPGVGPAYAGDRLQRGIGRVRLNLTRESQAGMRLLVISDAGLMGPLHGNFTTGEIYAGVGQRMARYAQVFGHVVGDICLSVRSQDAWWASVLAGEMARGRVMTAAKLDLLAGSRRGWRDVVADVACAMPGARLWVLPHEVFAGRPEAMLAAFAGPGMPGAHGRAWLHRGPRLGELRGLGADVPAGEGRFQPFGPAQVRALRAAYADDLNWLKGGAEDMARLMDDPDKMPAGLNLAGDPLTRGRRHDDEEGRMAGTR